MHFPFVSAPKSNPHRRREVALASASFTITGIKPTIKPSIALPKPTVKTTSIKTITTKAVTTQTTTTKTSTATSKTISKTTSKSSSSSSASSTPAPKATPIPAGQPFAGRLEGGGTRDDIFGTQTYGSGYPGISGRGTAGRGFPFYFWPIAWPAAAVGSAVGGLYLSDNGEYGSPSNTSRPGGELTTAFFTSIVDTSSDTTNTTSSDISSSDSSTSDSSPSTPTITTPSQPQAGQVFRLLADNATIAALVPHILDTCGPLLSVSTSSSANSTAPFTGTGIGTGVGTDAQPHPEQVVQYYRASSIALSMDGYNNSATYDSTEDDSPMPSTADLKLMDCLNQTIGAEAPLADAAHQQTLAAGAALHGAPSMSLAGVVGLLWLLRLLV